VNINKKCNPLFYFHILSYHLLITLQFDDIQGVIKASVNVCPEIMLAEMRESKFLGGRIK
jgi:hypothetical protein